MTNFFNNGTFNKNAGSNASQSFGVSVFNNNSGATFNISTGSFDWGATTSNAGTVNIASDQKTDGETLSLTLYGTTYSVRRWEFW